ncbi:Transposable element Hobo transposase, partial [Frankliniella fusca]
MAQATDLKEPLSSYSIEVLHDHKKSSFVWKHFGNLILQKDDKRKQVYKDKIFCKPCFVATADKSNNPENDEMLTEVEETGEVLLASVLFEIKAYNKSVSTGNLSSHLRDAHNLVDNPKKKPGATMTNFFSVKRTPKLGDTEDQRRWLLARDLALWYCRSLIPFDFCDDIGTNDFMKKYNVIGPNEVLPSRVTVSGTALRDVYNTMFAFVKREVGKASPYGAISLDGWSDSSRRNSYFAFIYDAITDHLEKRRFVLQTTVCNEKKDHLQIIKEINFVLRRFELEDKDITYVTDKGSNMLKAIQTMGTPHHLCLGHGVHNLVSKDGIQAVPIVATLCKKARAVCKAVRYRAPTLERENTKQQQLDWVRSVVDADEHADADDADPIPDDTGTVAGSVDDQSAAAAAQIFEYPIAATPTSVKLPVPTRWHTVLIMLEILEQNKVPINIVLSEVGKEDLHFNNTQHATLKAMVGFLGTFRRVVEILSSESCTINLALLLRSELDEVMKENEDDSLVVGDLKRRLRERLNFRFPVNDLLVTASLLDPRCADLVVVNKYLTDRHVTKAEFLSRQVRYNVLEMHLPPDARREQEEEDLFADSVREPAPSTSTGSRRGKRKAATTTAEETEAVEKEVRLYLDSFNPDDVKDNDILAYWRGRIKQYP